MAFFRRYVKYLFDLFFFFSSRRRHTRWNCDWSSDVCSSDLLVELSLEDWDATMGVNVRSLYLVTRAFLKSMLDAGTGTIVNIASLAGKNGVEGGTAYCASKHAVLGFSKSLMLEVRKRGLRVVAICPGSVSTPFMDKRERVRPAPDRALGAEDVAHAVVATLTVADRAMISEVDIRPTNP